MISRMVLMFQREVAARIRAVPGDDGYGALSVFTALYWDAVRFLVHSVFIPERSPASESDPYPASGADQQPPILAAELRRALIADLDVYAHCIPLFRRSAVGALPGA